MLDGYLPVTFTVEDGTTEYNLELYQDGKFSTVTVNDTAGTIAFSHNNHDGGPSVMLDDEAITGEHYMTEFTVKYNFDEGKNWAWTQRFTIRLGMTSFDQKAVGFMFFLKGDKGIKGANAFNDRWLADGGEREPVDNFLAENGTEVIAVNAAIKGDGLKVRGVRNGNKLTVYFLIGETWTPVWEKTVEGLSAYAGITATSDDSVCTVSNVSYGEYVAATETKQAHLTDGTNVYTLDGVKTTDEALAIGQE